MGKSKKEVVDLKPEKISEEQLKDLQQVVSVINKLQFDIGTLEVQKHTALRNIVQGNERLNDIREKLQSQYGTIDIDISSGAINYKEDEPSDS
jgi:hypothetical protein